MDEEVSPASINSLSPSNLKHDPWLIPVGLALTTLGAAIFTDLERQRQPGKQAPRSDALERRRAITANIVANLAACSILKGPAGRVTIKTKHTAIIDRYDRPGFPPQAVAESISGLERIGVLHRYAGSMGNAATMLEPSESFATTLRQHGITTDYIGRVAAAEAIMLKAPDPMRPDMKVLLPYADTAKTRRLRAEMQSISAFINRANITANGVRQLPIHLTRQFQIDAPDAPQRFDAHGRIYGGWWIDMPSIERHTIRIDGERCAYLDFTAMLTCCAYGRVRAPMPDGDPYSGVPGVERPCAEQREAIKHGLNALYFRRGPMKRLPPEVKAGLGSGWTADRLMRALAQRHAPIAHLFGTSIGLRLLYVESNIMVRTLLILIDRRIVALPIHDGLLCTASKAELAADAMRQASEAITGTAIPIKLRRL